MKHQRIIIYLHPTSSTQVSWLVIDEANQIIESVFNGDLTQFPTHTNADDIRIIVPTEHVLLHRVALPKLSRQRLLQALPFALEEQLIDDVSNLHFALGDYQADGTWPVAIVATQKMQEWSQLCKEINVIPRAFIPSIYLLPYSEKTWHINTDENHCLVRTEKYCGFACEKQNLDIMLDLTLAEDANKQDIQLQRTDKREQDLLEALAHTPLDTPINILQGLHQPKAQSTQTKKIWILTGYLAIALIALGVFSNIVSFFILNTQANKLDTAINAIYKKNFPNAKSVIAPRERMTEKLRGSEGSLTKNSLLILLGQIGKALSETQGVRIQTLEFKEQLLKLTVVADAFANLDKLTSALTQQGLTVKQQNAETAGNQVKATITIRQGAA
jgi:general secretion pathway protein L